jgi:predicted MFS family arabinose efflux permease
VLPIALLGAVGFLSSAGARVIDPLLHAIATDFGTTVPAVSIVVAAFTLPYGLAQLLLGPLGDRFGKLRVMLCALLAYAAATGSCALATDLPALTLLRICAGAASAALIPVAMAYIGDAVPYTVRQVTLSRFLTGVVLAAVVAGPVGGVFGEYVGWRGVFLVLAGGALAVAVLLARRIGGLPDRRGVATFRVVNYLLLARRRNARRLLLATFADGLLLVGCFPFLAPYLHEALGRSYAEAGLILACFGLGAFVYTRTAWWLVPRFGEAGLVLIGGVIMAGGLALGISVRHWAPFLAVEFSLGLGFTMLHGVMQARATELLPRARATAVSSFAFMLFVGQAVGALAMGAAIGTLGYRMAFAAQAVLVLALAVVLHRLFRAWR